MYCPNCGFKNSDEMRFCGNCGNELPAPLPGKGPAECANCGAELPAGIKFCGVCGAAVGAAPIPYVPPSPVQAQPLPSAAPVSVPAPVSTPLSAPAPEAEKKPEKKKIGIKKHLIQFAVWFVVGSILTIIWVFIQPQISALRTAYGRNPQVAEAAAQSYIDENFPQLSYAARSTTFSTIDGIPTYVVDFINTDVDDPYGVRLLVDRITLEVKLYQTENMSQQPSAATTSSQPATNPAVQSSSQFQLPAVASLLLTNPQLVESTDFTTFTAEGWSGTDNVVLETGQGGLLELPGSPSSTAYVASPPLAEGRGIIIRFKLTNSPNNLEMFLASGEWNTSSYRRLGVALYETSSFEPTVWKGAESRTDQISSPSLDGALTITTDHWYGLFVGSDTSGNLRVYVWDWENPAQYVWTSLHNGIVWDSLTWNFIIQDDKGTVSLDDYGVVAFGGFK
jgi:hypothetical protein